MPETPFNRACDLLGHTPPLEAIQPVGAFLNEPSEYIRKDAALVVGKVGSAEIVPLLRQALADPNDGVHAYALMGLQWAIKNQRLSPTVGPALVPDLVELLRQGKNADCAAELLVEFDAGKATEFFLSPAFFKADSRDLHEALEALANHDITVPREQLLALIGELQSGEWDYPRSYNLGEALHCLGQHRHRDDRQLLERMSAHQEVQVARGAARGLLAYHSLQDFSKKIWDTLAQRRFESLTREQRYWAAVSMFDGEVNNGGLSQYFFNSSGDHWQDALAGLEAIGAPERAEILRQAVAGFGSDGPSPDHEQRQNQLSQLAASDDELFEPLNGRYFASRENIAVAMTRYVIQNAKAFQ